MWRFSRRIGPAHGRQHVWSVIPYEFTRRRCCGVGGAALVIRAGGGRAGESFPLESDRLSVGRRPDSDVFLDDVTVSRDHALIVRRGSDFYLDDCGSLNGTYVNRRRIDSHRLADGDELQIGKYKLAFLSR
jgi:pSer/pThr/pTyr-binding forkhead associated (FHA) protein